MIKPKLVQGMHYVECECASALTMSATLNINQVGKSRALTSYFDFSTHPLKMSYEHVGRYDEQNNN
jgi:hypothetical protein